MWGLSSTGLANMTTREVLGRVSNFKNLEKELEESAALEAEVLATDQQRTRIQVAPTWEGIVRIRQIIVTPVTGLRNQHLPVLEAKR